MHETAAQNQEMTGSQQQNTTEGGETAAEEGKTEENETKSQVKNVDDPYDQRIDLKKARKNLQQQASLDH